MKKMDLLIETNKENLQLVKIIYLLLYNHIQKQN